MPERRRERRDRRRARRVLRAAPAGARADLSWLFFIFLEVPAIVFLGIWFGLPGCSTDGLAHQRPRRAAASRSSRTSAGSSSASLAVKLVQAGDRVRPASRLMSFEEHVRARARLAAAGARGRGSRTSRSSSRTRIRTIPTLLRACFERGTPYLPDQDHDLPRCRSRSRSRIRRELEDEIRITVLHELAHYFGIDEERLERAGLRLMDDLSQRCCDCAGSSSAFFSSSRLPSGAGGKEMIEEIHSLNMSIERSGTTFELRSRPPRARRTELWHILSEKVASPRSPPSSGARTPGSTISGTSTVKAGASLHGDREADHPARPCQERQPRSVDAGEPRVPPRAPSSSTFGERASPWRPAGQSPPSAEPDFWHLYTGGLPRGVSSAGRAPALQAGGHRFDPGTLHSSVRRNLRYEPRPLLRRACLRTRCTSLLNWLCMRTSERRPKRNVADRREVISALCPWWSVPGVDTRIPTASACVGCAARRSPRSGRTEERKVVSVLFVDFVGLTARADRADPEDVRATLRPYHATLKREIERFGGTVEKFVGDAVMAVFGAPVAHEDDAERAVRAALRILARSTELNERKSSSSPCGPPSPPARPSFPWRRDPGTGEGIATGDVVNTAARLQAGGPGRRARGRRGQTIACDARMRSSTRDSAGRRSRARPSRRAIWRALPARELASASTRKHARRAPFVGRERELRCCRTIRADAREKSEIQLVTIAGEPGVGEDAGCVAEFRTWVDGVPELVSWRQGRCLPVRRGDHVLGARARS